MWFAGFHVIAILSRERSTSIGPREIGWLMQISILAALVFYACVVLAASHVVPWRTLISASLPAFAAFKEGLGSGVANLVLISGLLGICSAWIACFAAGVRILVLLTGSTAQAATVAIASIASVLLLAGRAALVPIVNVAALCFGLVYLAVSIAAWRRAKWLKERVTTAAGAVVAAFMSAYVLVSAINVGGWLAPETMVALAALLVARGFWIVKSKSLAHAK
jgi:hypothetical protein